MFNGKAHDLTIFKQTIKVKPSILIIGDSGYRGMHKIHPNALLPIRHKADIDKLSEEQKVKRKAKKQGYFKYSHEY